MLVGLLSWFVHVKAATLQHAMFVQPCLVSNPALFLQPTMDPGPISEMDEQQSSKLLTLLSEEVVKDCCRWFLGWAGLQKAHMKLYRSGRTFRT